MEAVLLGVEYYPYIEGKLSATSNRPKYSVPSDPAERYSVV
jgi:hypothetical protein